MVLVAVVALPGSVDAGETGWGVCEALAGLGRFVHRPLDSRRGSSDGRDEGMRPARCAQSARVGDYVSMSDSEFRRSARSGSNDFWCNSVAILSYSLLHTALDFVNVMVAEHTNPRRSRSLTKLVELRLDVAISREIVPATPR